MEGGPILVDVGTHTWLNSGTRHMWSNSVQIWVQVWAGFGPTSANFGPHLVGVVPVLAEVGQRWSNSAKLGRTQPKLAQASPILDPHLANFGRALVEIGRTQAKFDRPLSNGPMGDVFRRMHATVVSGRSLTRHGAIRIPRAERLQVALEGRDDERRRPVGRPAIHAATCMAEVAHHGGVALLGRRKDRPRSR